MKQILILFLTVPFFSSAQECAMKKEKDQFSQQPKVTSGFFKLSNGKLPVKVNLESDSKEIKVLFSLGEGQCYDDQSTAIFTFDGTRSKSTQKNATSMNCDGMFSLVFRNGTTTAYALQKMGNTRVNTITLVGNGKQKTEIVLTEEEKQMLLDKVACLITESKKLIGQ